MRCSGYGRSEGSPSPTSLQGAAKCVVEHVRVMYGVNKLIVHGESIGVRMGRGTNPSLNVAMLSTD